MRAYFAILFVLGFPPPGMAAQNSGQTKVSFEDLPRLVREKNDNVQAAQSTLRAEEKRTGYLTRSFLPHVSANVGGEEFKTGSDPLERQGYWKVEGKVNVYRGGRDSLENSVRETSARIAGSSFSYEFQQELKEARRTYWKLVATTKLINDRKESLEKNELNLKSARRRSGAGVATTADALQFELQKTLLAQELKKLQLQQDLLRNQLSVAIGLDEHEGLHVEGDFPHPDEQLKVGEINLKNNLGVTILNERENAASLKRAQAARWWHPKVDIYTSYGLPSLSDDYARALRRDREWAVGVRIGLDLGEGFEMRNEAGAKALEAESLQRRASHKARETVAADHELRHDLKLLHELIHDADKDIEKTEKFLKLTEDEYRRGVKNGPDLLGAFQQLYEFRQRRTDLYRDYHETYAELTALVAKEESQ